MPDNAPTPDQDVPELPTAASNPAEALEDAAEALKDMVDDIKLPFGRWFIKLLVEKVLVPMLIPALSGASAAAVGWYSFGKPEADQQIEVRAREKALEEVERLERARELIDRVTASDAPPALLPILAPSPDPLGGHEPEEVMDLVREEWEARYGADSAEKPELDQQAVFPERFVQERVNAKAARR